MAKNQLAQQQTPPLGTATLRQRGAKPARVAEESSQPRTGNLDRQGKKTTPPTRVNPLLQLIQKRPLLVWSALLATILLAGSVAMLGLTNPGNVKKGEGSEADASVVTQKTVLEERSQNNPPAWLFGAIALGCATGSWVILKQLKGSRRRRKLRRPLKPRSTSQRSVDRQEQKKASSPRRAVPAVKTPQRSAPSRFAVADSPLGGLPPVRESQPPLPDRAGERGKKPKLAESMDLRKRQPLSSLLRKP